jgi:nicotinamidase-related amidase
MTSPFRATLILIDLQKAIDHPDWGVRNNPEAESRAVALLRAWRGREWPLYHVKHNSVEPQSHYRPGQPGNAFKPEFVPHGDEPVIAKHTPSAFVGTSLESQLRESGEQTLVMCGVITNNSVEATVRHAGCLGFRVYLAEDACFTFARADWSGVWRTAADVHAMSLANLNGEYATVVRSGEILAAL